MGKRINTPLQSYNSLSKLTKSAQKPPAPPPPPPPPPLQVEIKHTVKLNTTSYWKQGTHQSMYYGKLENKKKTSMHLVTISVRLCMSEYTGNTLALCPMQTQLFLKPSCPFISYFNRYRSCQIREEIDNMKSILQYSWGTNVHFPSQSTPSRGAHINTHMSSGFNTVGGGNDK